jgi:7-cyano-7-deazaguanine synthase in queuosine biosynthesis
MTGLAENKMTDSRKAIVLLSGGMDSCVSVAIARERHGAGNIALLHAGYGQLTQDRERRASGSSCSSIISARLVAPR